MRDIDVRNALHRKVLLEHANDPDTLVLDELGLFRGVARIDVAVVNGRIHGFEIKSDSDTLARLPGQISVYNSVLDIVTLVVGSKHVDAATSIVPEWWGIKLVTKGTRGGIHFHDIRRPKKNTDIDPTRLASLLWKNEAVCLLESVGVTGMKSKNRSQLSVKLAQEIPLDVLRDAVRSALKARVGWRSVLQ